MKVRDIAAAAVFIALTYIVTRFTAIPFAPTRGVFNVGEVAIYLAALVYGPLVGALAGGLGSALADLQVAPPYWPFTLVIKGIEGYVVGYLAGSSAGSRLRAMVIGGVVLVAGYFLSQVLFYQTLGFAASRTAALSKAFLEMPVNVVQALAGIIVGLTITSRMPESASGRGLRE